MSPALNKHQSRTEETRRKLLAAAFRIFSRDGFERARLEDIAAEAGHTRGAFYANFDSKEDLFIALLEEQAAKKVMLLKQTLEVVEATPEAYMKALRTHYISLAGDHQWTMLMLEFKLHVMRQPGQRVRLAAAHSQIREWFHLELTTHLSKVSHEAERHARILLEVILSGLVLEHAYDPKRLDSEEMATLLGMVFDLLTAPKSLK